MPATLLARASNQTFESMHPAVGWISGSMSSVTSSEWQVLNRRAPLATPGPEVGVPGSPAP